MLRGLAFTALLIGAVAPAIGQDKTQLAQAALQANTQYLATTIACGPVIGDAYVMAARSVFEGTLATLGMGSDQAILYVDDIETKLRAQVAGRSVLDQVGKDGVRHADVVQSCMETTNEALRKVEVASARLRTAS